MIFTTTRKAKLLSVLFLGLFSLSSCEKFDENSLGSDLLPGEDQLGIARTDTFTLVTSTLRADTIIIDELSSNVIGSMNDPVFGKFNAGMMTQLLLPTENVNFDNGLNLTVDSVVLSLGYTGFYGDTLQPLVFDVYEMKDLLHKDSTYFSNMVINTLGLDNIAADNNPRLIQPRTRVSVDSTDSAPQLRIRIKNEFGQKILTAPTDLLADDKKFLDLLKGIYIVPQQAASTGVAALINPFSADSKLTIYYRNTAENKDYTFDLKIKGSSVRLTTFQKDYSGTPVELQLNGSENGNERVFLQSGGGLKIQVNIPWLMNLADSSVVAINKAELILPILPGSNLTLPAHDRLLALSLTADGKREILDDEREGAAHFDGFFNATDSTYHLNITRYLQQVISGTKGNYGLQIIGAGSGVTANRTILAGAGNGTVRPKLIVTYTQP